jgi:hypothetical protein
MVLIVVFTVFRTVVPVDRLLLYALSLPHPLLFLLAARYWFVGVAKSVFTFMSKFTAHEPKKNNQLQAQPCQICTQAPSQLFTDYDEVNVSIFQSYGRQNETTRTDMKVFS